jgi:hypothetical protein
VEEKSKDRYKDIKDNKILTELNGKDMEKDLI